MEAIISRGEQFAQAGSPLEEEENGRLGSNAASSPYLIVTTNLPTAGVPVVGPDGVVHLTAKGFVFDPNGTNEAIALIDERVVDQSVIVRQDGSIVAELTVPEDLSNGEHRVQVVQTMNEQEIVARSIFVKSALDEGDQS